MKKINTIFICCLSAFMLPVFTGCVEEVELVEELNLPACLTPSTTSASINRTDGKTVTFTWANSKGATQYQIEIYEGEETSLPADVFADEANKIDETVIAPEKLIIPASGSGSTTTAKYTLEMDKFYFARVRAQGMEADGQTRAIDDSKWADFPYPIATYDVRPDVEDIQVVERDETSVTLSWTMLANDTEVNQIRVTPDPNPDPDFPGRKYGTYELPADLTIEPGQPVTFKVDKLTSSTQYTFAIHYGSANRGEIVAWTRPDWDNVQDAPDAATFRNLLLEAATADPSASADAEAEPRVIRLTNTTEDYVMGVMDILGPVTVYGEQTADGKSPKVIGTFNILPALTDYKYTPEATADVPAPVEQVIPQTLGCTYLRLEALTLESEADESGVTIIDETEGAVYAEPITFEAVNCTFSNIAKSVIWQDKKAVTFDKILFDGCLFEKIGKGQDGFDFRKDAVIGSFTIRNSTLSNGFRSVIRVDSGCSVDELVFDHNTAYKIGDPSNKGIFYLRGEIGKFEITDNVFMAIDLNFVFTDKNTSPSPTTVSSNFYYKIGETAWGDEETTVFTQKDAIAGNGAVLSSDPCENMERGIFNVTNARILDAAAGDPRWLVGYVPEEMQPLVPVEYGYEWNLTDQSVFGKEVEQTTVLGNLKFTVENSPISISDKGMEFSSEAVLGAQGVPTDCAVSFLIDEPGSIFVSADKSNAGTGNEHITVAIGDADGKAAEVVGAVYAGASSQKIIFDQVKSGEQHIVYLYTCGPVIMSKLEWSDDVNSGSLAVANPEFTADVSVPGALTLTWDAVPDAGSYIISLGAKEPDAEYSEDEYKITTSQTSYTWANFPSGTYTINLQALAADSGKNDDSQIVGQSVTVPTPALQPMKSGSITSEDMEFLLDIVGNQSLTQSVYYKGFLFTASSGKKAKFNSADATGAVFNTGGSSSVSEAEPGRTIRFIADGPGKLTYVTVSNDGGEDRNHAIAVNYVLGADKTSKARPSSAPASWDDYTYSEEMTDIVSGTVIDLAGGSDPGNINYLSVTWEPVGDLPAIAGLTPVTEATTWGAEEWAALYAQRTDPTVLYGKDFNIADEYFVINNFMIYSGAADTKFRVGEDNEYIQLASSSCDKASPQEYDKCFLRFRAGGNGTLTVSARNTSGSGDEPGARLIYVAVGGSADAVSVGTVLDKTFDAGVNAKFTEYSWDITASNGDAITIFENKALRIDKVTWTPAQ